MDFHSSSSILNTKKNHSGKVERPDFTSTWKFQVNKEATIILRL